MYPEAFQEYVGMDIYLDVYVPDATRVEVEPDELHEVGSVSVSQLVYLGRIAGTAVQVVHRVRNLVALVVVDLSHDFARGVRLFGKETNHPKQML